MKACGNHSVKCGYREGKHCRRPRDFKCSYILNKLKDKKE